MPKQKTHRGAKKRFSVTATGKVRRNHALRNHILTKKSPKRKRQLRRKAEVAGAFAGKIKRLIQS